ncbi:ATP-binding protein [Rhizobium sp. BR 315]|uniref:ATP-binding protein n=1 Tax=Rhizobium sp. BR 315 TaxID=3040014 RepID=UPI003D32B939
MTHHIDHFRSLLDPRELEIIDRVEAMNSKYIAFGRDENLASELRILIASLAARRSVHADKRRILTLVGQSGAGKSFALKRHLSRLKQLAPYADEDNVRIDPILCFDSPSPCLQKSIAQQGLTEMGLSSRPSDNDSEVWDDFRKALRQFKIQLLVVDEAQDAIETANRLQEERVADALKKVTQMADWPVRLILCGTREIGDFVQVHDELRNRNRFVFFDRVNPEVDFELLIDVVRMIIEVHASLIAHPDLLTGDFVGRLAHAYTYDLGTIIKEIRAAVELALYADRDQVILEDFITGFRSANANVRNVFTTEYYHDIDVREDKGPGDLKSKRGTRRRSKRDE